MTHGLSSTLFPKETTRKTTPSQKRPGPSPKGPVKTSWLSTTRTNPNPTLCSPRTPHGTRTCQLYTALLSVVKVLMEPRDPDDRSVTLREPQPPPAP